MEKTIWIYAHWNTYSKETEYQLSTYERSDSYGDVLIGTRTIEFETLNDKELRVNLSKTLKAKLDSMRAYHYQEENGVQDSINELLSLEYKPEVAVTKTEDDIPF